MKHIQKTKILTFILVVLAATLFFGTGKASAASMTVTANAVDQVVNGNCSLLEAVEAANTDSAVDGCISGSGADVINVSDGTYDLGLNFVGLTLTSDIALIGESRQNTIIEGTAYAVNLQDGGGNPSYTIQNMSFDSVAITSSEDVDITLDTIAVSGADGYIDVNPDTDGTEYGSFVMRDSIISNVARSGLTVSATGYSSVELTGIEFTNVSDTSNSTLSRLHGASVVVDQVNIVGSNGGIELMGGDVVVSNFDAYDNTNFVLGFLNGNTVGTSDISMSVLNTSITNNSGFAALWVMGDGATDMEFTIQNTTLANNQVVEGALIFWVRDDIVSSGKIENISIVNNEISNPSGLGIVYYNTAGNAPDVTIQNTLIANNLSGATAQNCGSPADSYNFDSLGNNLSDDTTCSGMFNDTNDLNDTNAELGLLTESNNTWVVPLLATSPAVDGGVNIIELDTDQRGVARPQGLSADIGAYELISDEADGGGGGTPGVGTDTGDLAETGMSTISTIMIGVATIIGGVLIGYFARPKLLYSIRK